MRDDEVLSGLEQLLENLGVELRYEKGDFNGGYCVLEDKPMMIINKGLDPAQRIRILATELAKMNLESVFILPALRQVIGEAANQLQPSSVEANAQVVTTTSGV